ncbi:spindle assembly abnormal protein 6, putative [Plasmodium gaboni]|uniref:Spindle assembly abnormal protein 6, putative n=1 Tax=Plasmodium gaboni TaxID=647221 RepID=A0ABY1UJA3_9APIC|nr:spindle assembly abnormal protein 6, putative [Plasmodium gaboni]
MNSVHNYNEYLYNNNETDNGNISRDNNNNNNNMSNNNCNSNINYFDSHEKRNDSLNNINDNSLYRSKVSLKAEENRYVQNNFQVNYDIMDGRDRMEDINNSIKKYTDIIICNKRNTNNESVMNNVNNMNNMNNNYKNNSLNGCHIINVGSNNPYDNNTEITDNNNNNNNNNSVILYKPIDMSFIYKTYDKNGMIYCKRIKFYLKKEREHDYTDYLIVKINSLKGPGGKPYMRLELSDDKKEFFFYYLDLYEENYEKIKKEQKLVINFNLFPFKFIDLLEECVLENDNYEHMEDQRLNAVLIFTDSSLKDSISNNNINNNNTNNNHINNNNNSNSNNNNNNNCNVYNLSEEHGMAGNQNRNNFEAHKNSDYNNSYYYNDKRLLSNKVNICDGNAILNLVEINQFKELTHLSLVLKKGDNANIITHLCNNITYVKEYNKEIINKLNDELIKNNKSNIDIKNFQKTIEQLENKMKVLTNNFNHTLNNDINNLKETHQKIIIEKEERYNQQNDELKKIVDNFKNKCNELHEMNETQETTIFHLNSKIKNLKNELEEKNFNLLKIIKEKESIESEKEKLEKYKNTFTLEFNDLKNKYEKECESNLSNNSSFESIKLSNTNLETELKKYKERNFKLENEINIAIDEINKGNDIITKLQTQLKKMKDKLKNKTLEHENLEKMNSQNEKQITQLNNELKNLKDTIEQQNVAQENIKKENDMLKKKYDELVKELNISREVNLRLNKEITNNNLDIYNTKLNPMAPTPNVLSGVNFRVDTNLLDKDLFTKLKANLKNSSIPNNVPGYTLDSNMNHMNLMNGKIDTLDMNDRYNKPVKFIPPGI